ncbi:MAG: prephenate dehydrogenase [Alphaproteobacteria bacterium]
MSAVFERIAIIGLGLIGSSIARAAREHKLANTIVGCDKNHTALAYAQAHHFVDVISHEPEEAVAQSELVILATPPSTFEHITKFIAPALRHGAIVMDTASVKRTAIQFIHGHLPEHVYFIPAHPIAGSEQSGVSAGRADLFSKRYVIVTPDAPEMSESLQKITAFWKGMGAKIEGMPADMHDMIYAYVSHLPHLLAYAARLTLHTSANAPQLQTFLRLSNSNPDLWSELFYLNQDNILTALNRYVDATNHVLYELEQAPDDAPQNDNEDIARTLLFPRIAAACLITTAMEAERKAGVPFARFAGQGFADFVSPASAPPDADIENISGHSKQVAALIRDYNRRLALVHDLLARNQYKELSQVLSGK